MSDGRARLVGFGPATVLIGAEIERLHHALVVEFPDLASLERALNRGDTDFGDLDDTVAYVLHEAKSGQTDR